MSIISEESWKRRLAKELEPALHLEQSAFPQEIYICGLRHSITTITDGSMGFAHGMACAADQTIKLNTRWCKPDYLKEILLHEIIHLVDQLVCEPGIKSQLENPPNPNGYRLTEPCVLGFSRGLWMTLTDPRNKKAVAWMMGGEG